MTAPASGTGDAMADLAAERERQEHLGWTRAHDDAHYASDWIMLLTRYMGRVADAAEEHDADLYRRRLVQVGAIALAAVEGLDRARAAGGNDPL